MTETLQEKCARVAKNFAIVGKRATAHILFGSNYKPERPNTEETMLRYCILLDRIWQFSRHPEKKYLQKVVTAFRDVVLEVSNDESNKVLSQIMLCDTVDIPRMAILDSLVVLWHGEHKATFKNHTKAMTSKIDDMVYVLPNGYQQREHERLIKEANAAKEADQKSKKEEEEKRKREVEDIDPWSETDSDHDASVRTENGSVKKRRRLRKMVVQEDKMEDIVQMPQVGASPAPIEEYTSTLNQSQIEKVAEPEVKAPAPIEEQIDPELRPFSERTRWPYEEVGTSSKFKPVEPVQPEPPVAEPEPVKKENKPAASETSSKFSHKPRWCEGHSNRISAVAGEYAVQEMVWNLMKSLPHGFRVEQKNGKFKLVVTKTIRIPITIEKSQATKRTGYYAYVDQEKL